MVFDGSELKSRWALPGIPTSRSAITMRSTFQCSAAVLANMLRSLVWLQEMVSVAFPFYPTLA